ncbi:hypothetical protein QWY75_05835 [Pontixanthobacter aestiaquae]|uniref:Uncharacterized protein n=1 Tax=Pontixanthobacter aestiaquae TaxID=1509367 RepID=A0A844ZBR3_9SPHN|nr:hypothetical protein [Pontixanthobacter aestiaquae]MDN3645725.1 hypothetical protein [Pontixanthobacter aestiaquae]MXO83279.1 hypothetical protein [Pontixanthobacter aestiaquae]
MNIRIQRTKCETKSVVEAYSVYPQHANRQLCKRLGHTRMLAFALISLFSITAAVVVISLSDSFIRGVRAFKQLRRAVKLEKLEDAGMVQASSVRPNMVITRQRVEHCGYPRFVRPLRAAA